MIVLYIKSGFVALFFPCSGTIYIKPQRLTIRPHGMKINVKNQLSRHYHVSISTLTILDFIKRVSKCITKAIRNDASDRGTGGPRDLSYI